MKAFHDVHTHNYLSACSHDNLATAESFVYRAAELGLKVLGFANHTWDERVEGASPWYRDQSLAFQMQIKTQIPEDTRGVKVLVGAETEYCGMSDTLGMSREGALQNLDFLLIPHSHVHMRNFVMADTPSEKQAKEAVKERLLKVAGITEEIATKWANALKYTDLQEFMTEPKTDYVQYLADFLLMSFDRLMENESLKSFSDDLPVSIAHPFQPVGSGQYTAEILRRIPDSAFERIFAKAAARGIGLEINPACNYPEMLHMLEIAKNMGCKFTLGSDTHSIVGMEGVFRTDPSTDALGLTEYDFMDFVRI